MQKIEEKKNRLLLEANKLYETMYIDYFNGNKDAFNKYRPLIKEKRFEAALLNQMETEEDISSALGLVEGSDVWDLFVLINKKFKLSPKIFAFGLKWAWTESYPGPDVLPYLNKVDGKLMMNDEELEYYNNLPEIVELFRGCDKEEMNIDEDNFLGISWTTSRKVAEFFAFRHNTKGRIVVKTEVPKKEIVAFINERKEFECIYLSAISTMVSIVTDKPTKYFDCYIEEKDNM